MSMTPKRAPTLMDSLVSVGFDCIWFGLQGENSLLDPLVGAPDLVAKFTQVANASREFSTDTEARARAPESCIAN